MRKLSPATQVLGLAAWLLVCFTIAGLGAVASIDATAFYTHLELPDWAPPASVFGPAWTTIFVLMAVAAWLVWRQGGFRCARVALSLFLAHLPINALWSWLFFAWRLGGAAFADVLLLWITIAVLLVLFWRRSRYSGVLLLPYLAWVTFAAALNFTVWRLNPDLTGQ
ncbi:MAG: tryptophan-rich sensory protein [Proteobacteria bacterium]|nr:MAG: tryptophan-rich sensory protein [Pseudomonadota bacterium]